jgi:putative transposase
MKSWVQLWKSLSARLLIKAFSVKSPVWQEDYFDRYLRSTESFAQKWEYVRHNPVRAGLVTRPEDWAYSGRICTLT